MPRRGVALCRGATPNVVSHWCFVTQLEVDVAVPLLAMNEEALLPMLAGENVLLQVMTVYSTI